MIIGAIDDDFLLERVLEHSTDSAVVIECMLGTCGRQAKEWVEVRCERVLDQLRDEAGTVRYAIDERALGNIAFEAGSLTAWRGPDRAVLTALPQLLVQRHHLDSFLDIVALMDHRIAEEQRRLQDEARERKLPIRSGLFANTYVLQTNHAPGITHVCSQLRRGVLMLNGLFRSSEDEICTATVQNWIARHDLSPGQMYVLLALGGQCLARSTSLHHSSCEL